MPRLPRLPRPGGRHDRDAGATRPPGLPDWLPRPNGERGRDRLPTHTYRDVVRLFHRGDDDGDEGWPEPVLPWMDGRALSAVLGRDVPPVPRPGERQARAVLDALGGSSTLHALVSLDHDLGAATTGGWTEVDASMVGPVFGVRRFALTSTCSVEDGVRLWATGPLTHLWCADWIVLADPTGRSSSSLLGGTHGTAHRLREAGLDALPVGHAWSWPPAATRPNA